MNKNGTVIFQNEAYFFRLIEFKLILERIERKSQLSPKLLRISKRQDQTIYGLELKDDDEGNAISLKINGFITRTNRNRFEAQVDYYIIYKGRIWQQFNRIQFTSPELNQFYNLQKGYELQVKNTRHEENRIILKSNTENTFQFNYLNRQINGFIGIGQKVSLHAASPLTLATRLVFEFGDAEEMNSCREVTMLVRDFLQFICYRQDVNFTKITLMNTIKLNDGNEKIEEIGELVMSNLHYATLADTEGNLANIIHFEHLEQSMGHIFELLAQDNLYLKHIPRTVDEWSIHSIEKTILTAAAFEWEFAKIYPHAIEEYHRKNQEYQQEFLTIINQLLDTSAGKEKKYYKNMKYIVQNSNMNLSKRLQFALTDVKDIIGEIIDKMYSFNNFEGKNKVHKIADRIQSKRNTYAHGNLATTWTEEEEKLMLGDMVTLQLLYYAIVLKDCGLTVEQAMRSIDSLFDLGIFKS